MKTEEILKKIDQVLGDDENFKDIVFGVKKAIKAVKLNAKKLDKLGKRLDKINKEPDSIKRIEKLVRAIEITPEVTVKFPKQIKTETPKTIVNVPKEMAVKKPKWYKPFDFKALRKALKADTVNVHVTNKEPASYIPVRLTNGRDFYNALFQVMSRGSGAPGTTRISNLDGSVVVSLANIESSSDNLDGSKGLVVASALYGRIGDNAVRPVLIDGPTHSQVAIEYEHHEIHNGESYYAENFATVNTDGLVTLLLITPAGTKWAHVSLVLESTKGTLFEFFENTNSTGGTAVTPKNRNRNHPNGSTITVTHTPSAQTSGTLLQTKHVGSAGKYAESGKTRGMNEWVLKPSTTYLFRATSHEDANEIVLGLNWYELTNKS